MVLTLLQGFKYLHNNNVDSIQLIMYVWFCGAIKIKNTTPEKQNIQHTRDNIKKYYYS